MQIHFVCSCKIMPEEPKFRACPASAWNHTFNGSHVFPQETTTQSKDHLDQLFFFSRLIHFFPAKKFCPMVFDSFLCWPQTKAGESVWQKCPDGVRGLDSESKLKI